MTAYTPWHVARLRDRLARYRAFEGDNGRSRTWYAIAKDIRDFETPAFKAEEPSTEVLAEALRRFTDQKHVLRPARLDAVAIFLKGKGYVSDADLTEVRADYEVALAAVAQMDNGDDAGDGALLAGTFTADRKYGSSGMMISTLELHPAPDSPIIQFRETREYSPAGRVIDRRLKPGCLRAFAGYRSEYVEGWLVRRHAHDAFALVHDRHLGQHFLYLIPHHRMRFSADEHEYLTVMKLDRFDGGEKSEVRSAVGLADAVNDWVRERSWLYRYRPATGEA
jgi:hypothetical protein